jgi:GNAT superfamily N-acetyltransferase
MARKKTPFSIRRATMDDLDEIERILHPTYFEESGYNGLDYCAEGTRRMIAEWIANDVAIIISSQGEPAAFGAMCLGRTFYKQIEADVEIFYVMPKFRATGIARALTDILCRIADANGAAIIYSSCLSGMGDKNHALYVNLWKKYGFRELGTVMLRS